jgi:hypothetical protein
MNKLSKGDVAVNGLLPKLTQFINDSWRTAQEGSETAYRDSLVRCLRDSVPEDCRVEREYRHAGTTVDIYISWKGILSSDEVFIEMKRDLQKKATFDRLIGQLEELDPEKHKIILVLIGKTDEGLLGRLKSRYEKFITRHLSSGGTMAIIVKS